MNLVTENKIGIKKLKNGLTVKLIEKPNFKTFNVQMIVNFGSSDSLIDQVQIPPGSAHLIEHLLFHKKNHDMDYLFSQMGIDSNAYTTYNVTNFFYTTLKKDREYFKKSLEYLFELVLDAYFTNDLIKKEIEIISSEIKITEDDTDSDLYTELLANLYPKTPLSYDILGTEKTIRTVDKNLLKRLHEKFYQPQNIVLYVCGPISFSELIEVVESVANLDDQKDIELNSNYYYLPVKNKKSNFNNKLSKLVYGWSLPNLDLNYRDSIIFSLYLENMLGKRSQFFHRMYNDGVINDDFYYEFVVEKNFTVLFFSCLTEDPKKIINSTWESLHSEKISEEKLAVTVKNFVGKYIQSFDSIEDLASIETDGKFHLEDAVDSLKIVDGLEVSQVQEIAKKVFSQNQFASAGKVIS